MRKPRDFDSELKALTDKAKALKERKVMQLGELVIACGGDTLNAETLAGALLSIIEQADTGMKEAWAKRGATLFLRASRGKVHGGTGKDRTSDQAHTSDGTPR